MYSSSIPARAVPKLESKVSAERRHRSKLPSFVVQSQNQIVNSFLQLQQIGRADESVRGLVERDRAEFFGLVKRIEIRQKQVKQQFELQSLQEQMVHRSGVQRRRNEDNKLVLRNRPSKKVKISHYKPLSVFYRYQLVSLCSLLGRRQEFMASLRIKKTDVQAPPLTHAEVEDRLKKQVESKGKDKGRQTFNIIGNDQLRCLKYKKKTQYTYNNPFRQKDDHNKNNDKDDQEEEEQEQQDSSKKEEKLDYATWRRRNGVGRNQKVFIVKGGYHELRKALLERGWFENEDVWSPFFDLKWTTKIMDLDFYHLSPYQQVNHFNNNQGLTSKFGLARNLRTLVLGNQIDVDKFFPRCYDLGDQTDFQNFVENFKIGFAQTVVRRFLVQPDRYHKLELKMRLAIQVLERRVKSFSELLDSVNTAVYPMISPEDWTILTQTHELTEAQVLQKLKPYRKQESLDPQSPEYEQQLFKKFADRIKDALEKLKEVDPQIDMNGYHNIWIVKPNYLSRGRGIRCFNNLFDIVDYCFGKDIQYVAQKYIENPLVIHDRKFDIRQWVLIQDFNPPKVWFYEQCYIRFCTQLYSLENIHNRYIHLTNNSIQKYNHKFGQQTQIPGNMWSMAEFSQHIGEDKWKIVQQKIRDIVVWSVKSCEAGISARRNSFQLVGYDFMIDEHLNPWLIEINMSPAMDYSTHITKRLVKMVLHDTVKVIADNRKNRQTGLFTCIYRGEEPTEYDKYRI